MLDDMGLLPALNWLVERQAARGVQVKFLHDGLEGRLPPQVEVTAFRIAQESLTNVGRHADTARAILAVKASGSSLDITIEDYGLGFDVPAVLGQERSVGLPAMQEQVELLGGKLIIRSAPGEGTRLRVELPLNTTT